jgi:hypothetical protein
MTWTGWLRTRGGWRAVAHGGTVDEAHARLIAAARAAGVTDSTRRLLTLGASPASPRQPGQPDAGK